MKILAVDTSSKNCSVSIVEVIGNNITELNNQTGINKNCSFNVIISENNNDEKTHSQKLMPMIDDMFKKSKHSLDDIDLLACCLGPGSFTGIRIGIATVKAFADVKNIPTVGVTSLESLAYNVEENGFVCPIIDCKNENVYSSLFAIKEHTYSQIGDNIADSIDNSLNRTIEYVSNELASNPCSSSTITFIGDGSVLYKDLITSKFSEQNFKVKFLEYIHLEYSKNIPVPSLRLDFSENNTQSSISLAKCAYDKYLNKEFGDSNFISPLYLRKSQAEKAKFGE